MKPKTSERLPAIDMHEAEPQLTGATFMALMDKRWQMLELSPYVDKDERQNGPAQIAYDKVRSEIEPTTKLTDEHAYAVRYLANESSVLDTQLLVDSALMSDPAKFAQAVHEARNALIEARKEADNLSQQDIEERDDHIAQLSIVLDRLDEGAELSDGTELLDYLNFTDFASAWEHQSVVDVSDGKLKWIEEAREQKRQALERALVNTEAQWRTYLMLSQIYPSKLATGEGLDEENNS